MPSILPVLCRRYSAEAITAAVYVDDIALLANTLHKPNPCCIIWNKLQVALASMSNQTKRSTCVFNKKGDISKLNGGSLKLVDKFPYLESSVPSIENDINMRLAKAWTAIDSLLIIWKSDLSDKIKRIFFRAEVSILLNVYTTWMLG